MDRNGTYPPLGGNRSVVIADLVQTALGSNLLAKNTLLGAVTALKIHTRLTRELHVSIAVVSGQSGMERSVFATKRSE